MKVAKLYGKSLNGDCGTHHVAAIFDSEHGSDEGSSSGSISPLIRFTLHKSTWPARREPTATNPHIHWR